MDELESKFSAAQEHLRAAAPASGPEVYPTVRKAAKRRRVIRGTVTASVAVVALGVVGVGAWGLVGQQQAEPALPAPSITEMDAAPTPTPDPTITSTVETTPESPDPRFDDSPDGIAQDAYPALAAQRVAAVNAEGEVVLEYPEAHVLEEWVWDRTGSGWGLEVAAVQFNPYRDDFVQPTAVLYLVSPEDVWFEVAELPEHAWDDARVVSWREDQGVAMVWWASEASEPGRFGAGGAIDLRTGEVDDLRMSVYGEIAHDYRFVMANAQGDELWRAESDEGFKYYRWSEGADDDGWVASALVEEAPDADRLSWFPGSDVPFVRGDGDRLVLGSHGGWRSEAPPTPLIVYSLAADAVDLLDIAVPAGADTLMSGTWIDDDTVSLTADGVENDVYVGMVVGIDGSLEIDADYAGLGWGSWRAAGAVDVEFGKATHPDTAAVACGC